MNKRVIVIGSGGAGLTAAAAAAQEGADVILLSKAPCGKNTATIYSGGIFTLASGAITAERKYREIMETGQYTNNPDMVRYLAENAENALKEIRSWGVDVKFPKDGMASVRHTSPNKLMTGEGMLSQLEGIARSRGVRFFESDIVVRLLCGERGIEGVRAVNWRNGTCHDIFANAVVIATGGAGQIFSRTDNPSRLTGDGYALARSVGCELIDMEFTQFYPMGWDDPALPIWMADLSLIDYAPLTDADGDEFMIRALHEWGYKNGNEGNFYARDRASALIAQKGACGGAWLHIEKIPEKMWKDKGLIRAFILNAEKFKKLKRPVRVSPIHHYFCGGIKVGVDTHTEVPGLFACGEAAGGVDGANRIGGNALANIITFGLNAGKTAARNCLSDAIKTDTDAPMPIFSSYGTSPGSLRRDLQRKIWKCVGPVRTKAGLEDALAFLDNAKSTPLRAASGRELLEALEMPGLIESARAVAQAALKREKSCGVHFRSN